MYDFVLGDLGEKIPPNFLIVFYAANLTPLIWPLLIAAAIDSAISVGDVSCATVCLLRYTLRISFVIEATVLFLDFVLILLIIFNMVFSYLKFKISALV